MSKKDTVLFLRPGMAELLSKKADMPAGAVGYGKVLSTDTAKITLAVDDATVKVAYEGAAPQVDTVAYFNADGKMIAMEVPPKKAPQAARGSTGAARDERPSTLY
jgi:hypothetical protein